MTHSFDISIAKEVGVDCAVVLHHIEYWVNKNKANKKHFYDGMYWTYNSAKAFSELLPYFTERQIVRILAKLEEKKLIFVGRYNKVNYDQTKWYSVNDSLILRFRQMEITEWSNRYTENVEPIPDINTDINTDNKYISGFQENAPFDSSCEDKVKDQKIDFDLLLKFFNQVTGKKIRKVIPKAKKGFLSILDSGYSKADIKNAIINCYKDEYHINTNHKYLTLEFISRMDKFEKYFDVKRKVEVLPPDWFHRELTDNQKKMLKPSSLENWERNKSARQLEGGKLLPIKIEYEQ